MCVRPVAHTTYILLRYYTRGSWQRTSDPTGAARRASAIGSHRMPVSNLLPAVTSSFPGPCSSSRPRMASPSTCETPGHSFALCMSVSLLCTLPSPPQGPGQVRKRDADQVRVAGGRVVSRAPPPARPPTPCSYIGPACARHAGSTWTTCHPRTCTCAWGRARASTTSLPARWTSAASWSRCGVCAACWGVCWVLGSQ